MYIVDTSVLLSGFIPENREEYITVDEVVRELKNAPYGARMFKVYAPSKKSIMKIEAYSKKTGEELSVTDKKLLALALDVNGMLLTEDYGIQNAAKSLGIEFSSITTDGIREVYRWKKICRGCKKEYPLSYEGKCEVCGSDVITVRDRS
ncbi:MAG: ribonuclease VapC [Euryarchaeota archaeon]|nr:ribonuclease VapC [Euryarchaeota archaeon]